VIGHRAYLPDFDQCNTLPLNFLSVSQSCPTLYFLAGVTSSGKTELALDWAEENGAEVLSCDSVAVYKGMDIGSAKPTREEQARVVHHGLDLVNVDERFDVLRYSNYAQKIILDAYSRNSKILVVGGSGFYLHSFFSPVVDEVSVSEKIKKSVLEIYQEQGLIGLQNELLQYNPQGLGDIDQANPVRLIKYLERSVATGLSMVELKKKFSEKPIPYSDFQKRSCLLDRENDDLEQLILSRTQWMLSNGLIEEVEELITQGLLANYPASNAVGYREVLAYLKGERKKEELVEDIHISTRQLVSKQRKWFRKYYNPDQTLIPLSGQKLDTSYLDWPSNT